MTSQPPLPASPISSPEGSHGLVAWLDILGFKQLLNKDPSKGLAIWQTVWGFLNEVENLVKLQPPTDFQLSKLPSISGRFRFTAFSDSMVASLDLADLIQDQTELWNPEWHLMDLFVRRITYLTRRLFDFGLPARGVIDYGNFYHSGIGFGGHPFVCAEGESNKLGFAASIITDTAALKLAEAYDRLPHSSRPWFEYAVETKHDDNGRTFRILNAYEAGVIKATCDASEFERRLSDNNIEQIVESVFSDHEKTITDPRVKEKITNTIRLLKTAQRHSGTLFS